ncbi:MAG: DUF1016 N-terminal domain-containing protein, partial [Methylosarcina sp.]
MIFKFTKIGEEELVLADKLKNTLRRTREALAGNFDQQDPKFVTLKEELERLFKKKNLSEVTQDEMNANIEALNKIHQRIRELNRQNDQLRQKYNGDAKYTRIHKRLIERVQQAVGQIPWGHYLVLLSKVKERQQRLAYAQSAQQYGWSRNVLVHQIESRLLARQGQAATN